MNIYPAHAATFSAVAVACLCAGCGGGGGGSSGGVALPIVGIPSAPAAPAAPTVDCTLQLEGDSIASGGLSLFTTIAEVPAAGIKRMRPAYVVTDKSVIGNSAHARAPVFVNESIASRIVVIEFGVNDAGNSYPYEAAMRLLLDRTKALGKVVVITGLPPQRVPLVNADAYNAIAKALATEYGATFADWRSVVIDASDMSDDVHPLQKGSAQLVEQLVRALDQVAPECGK
ncbi:SGNH/GDSL hydrolase family protein [Variovorax paradoxus]|uniref:SGNH/GDSL hydrolase family protein n=1 Tax=Variovorax paradoxus TaxID=34073 RepID=UPI00247FF24A|nr:SGNH/GDSL hydrolase family protein [Variovorax paradoxus]WGT64773.1 SGNH/GDSL hydrolase family protein [Variovorax paradoxus]